MLSFRCRWRTTLAFVASVWLLASPVRAEGSVYKYIDASGVVHFTDSPRDARWHPVRVARDGLHVSAPTQENGFPRYSGYDAIILRTSTAYGLSPALVKAVIAAESAFDPSAVSRVGAQGLMQLMPRTSVALGVSDPFRPEQNVLGGVQYLRQMLDRYGDTTRALAAYNAGPTAVDRYEGVPPYRETRDYVRRVLTYYRHYHRDFPQ